MGFEPTVSAVTGRHIKPLCYRAILWLATSRRVLNQKFVDEKVSEQFTLDGIADTENDDLQVPLWLPFYSQNCVNSQVVCFSIRFYRTGSTRA